jgi:hypothetical protein
MESSRRRAASGFADDLALTHTGAVDLDQANGRSREISTATLNGRNWPISDLLPCVTDRPLRHSGS